MNVTIERDGYMVEARVGGIATGPGIAPGLEVQETTRIWIHAPELFAEAYGADAKLEDIIATEWGEIDDALIDAAQLQIAHGDY